MNDFHFFFRFGLSQKVIDVDWGFTGGLVILMSVSPFKLLIFIQIERLWLVQPTRSTFPCWMKITPNEVYENIGEHTKIIFLPAWMPKREFFPRSSTGSERGENFASQTGFGALDYRHRHTISGSVFFLFRRKQYEFMLHDYHKLLLISAAVSIKRGKNRGIRCSVELLRMLPRKTIKERKKKIGKAANIFVNYLSLLLLLSPLRVYSRIIRSSSCVLPQVLKLNWQSLDASTPLLAFLSSRV